MVKKLFIGIAVISAIIIGLRLSSDSSKPTNNQQPTLSPSPTPSPLPDQTIDYSVKGKMFRASWFTVSDIGKVFLYSNLDQKQTASEFISDKKCKEAVNAGFYTKEYKPVGLFVSEGKTLRDFTPNALFNGIVSISENNEARFLDSPPSNTRIALQTGPFLIRDRQQMALRIQNDQSARRIAVGLTSNNTLLYMAFYDPENVYEGPLLNELPADLQEFQKQTGIMINDALNLDGGSASAFYTKGLFLQELTPVGSFFCIR